MQLGDWFLTPGERGNPDTAVDRRGHGVAWSEGNRARVLIDGTEYFARLHEQLCLARPGDWVLFTDLEGDGSERLDGPGTEVAKVLADVARRGTHVRGLLWRSHPTGGSDAQIDNLTFSRVVNEAGGEVLLDNRVRRGGSHHQKIVVLRHTLAGVADPVFDVAFVGGIDLAHGRRDDGHHSGDPQAADLDPGDYGDHPPWHDVHLEVHGPAVDDIATTFAERWADPAPIDRRTPWRALMHRIARQPAKPAEPVPDELDPPPCGPHAVQVLRTYPARRTGYPFARSGERSIARAYLKAFGRARRLIYLEDQYLWSLDAARALAAALEREPDLRLVVVVPRFPDPAGRIVGNASRYGRERVLTRLSAAGGDRVAVYDLENEAGNPIYVHAKVCIVDDTWMTVGSDNLNRRSWTHDSEIACAVIDETLDEREPRDLSGRGDGARVLARETRLRLAREHLAAGADDDAGRAGPVASDDLVDPAAYFDALRASARALDDWHAGGRRGPRPRGHLRSHPTERVGWPSRAVLHLAHAWILDPDGRPRRLHRHDAY